jgi:hypothetical protein
MRWGRAVAVVALSGRAMQSGDTVTLQITARHSGVLAWLQQGVAAARVCETGRPAGPVILRDGGARPVGNDGGWFPRIFFQCRRSRGGERASLELGDDHEEGVSFHFQSFAAARRFFTSALAHAHETAPTRP